MAKQNQPSSGSIISAAVFIILLIGLAIYAGQNNTNKKKAENKKTTTTNYTLIKTDSITTGPADAKVTFTEFYDYECPACQYFATQIMPTLEKDYAGKVLFVHKQFPLKQHEQAIPSATAVICANDQGKFVQYNDLLIKNYEAWTKKPALLEDYAKQTDLDMTKFNNCKTSKAVSDFIARDMKDGTAAKLEGTPTILINGEKIQDIQDLTFYKTKIDSLLAR